MLTLSDAEASSHFLSAALLPDLVTKCANTLRCYDVKGSALASLDLAVALASSPRLESFGHTFPTSFALPDGLVVEVAKAFVAGCRSLQQLSLSDLPWETTNLLLLGGWLHSLLLFVLPISLLT